MSIATNPWNDNNRFNQTGYSASTLFPKEEDYTNKIAYLDDLDKAEAREESHNEWLEELRQEAREDAAYEQDDECHNEGYN